MAPIHDLINDFGGNNNHTSSRSSTSSTAPAAVPEAASANDEFDEDGAEMETSTTSLKPEFDIGDQEEEEKKEEEDDDDEEVIAQLFPEIDKIELTKLLIQTLKDLGFHKSSSVLQKESNLPLESRVMNLFSNLIKSGDFESAVNYIDQLVLREDENITEQEMKRQILFLISREKFLEELYRTDSDDDPTNFIAVQILRNEINELTSIQTVRSLTSLLMNKDSEHLQLKNGWVNNSEKASRANLLTEISKFISPSSMIPKHRLFKLLQQSIQHQKSLNLYQFGDEEDTTKVSLYEDLKSNKTNFPDTVIKTLTDHTDEVWFVLFSHDGSKLITCSADSFIYIYDVNDNFKILKKLKGHNKQVMYASFSPDDSKLLTCSIESKARLWNVETGELERTFQLENDSRLWCCDWFPNGESLVIGSPDKEINIFNVNTGERVHKISGSTINDLKISSNNKLIVATYEKKVEVYELLNESFTKLKSIDINERITNISVSHKNPNQILINISPNELQLWDWSKGVLMTKYLGHKQEQYIIRSCFGYDEKLICSGSEDGRVFLWNKEFGALLGVFEAHSGICNCLAWNNAKRSMFASCGDDSVVKVWGPSRK